MALAMVTKDIKFTCRFHMLQAYCDLQREVLDRALGSLPNQATSSEDLSKMSWSQVEKKVNG